MKVDNEECATRILGSGLFVCFFSNEFSKKYVIDSIGYLEGPPAKPGLSWSDGCAEGERGLWL